MKIMIRSLVTSCFVVALATTAFAMPSAQDDDPIARGHALLEEGKFEDARALFASVLESEPENLDAHAGLARVEVAYGEINEAIDRLEDRLLDNSTHAFGNLYLGAALYLKAREGMDEAKTAGYVASLLNDSEVRLTNAANELPENLEAWQYLGILQYYKQNMPAAIAAFEKALELDPEDAFSYYQLGEVYQVQAQYETALPYYRRATECVDGYADAFRKIGLCHEFLQQYDEAGDAYRQAILAAPAYIESYKDLWRVYGSAEPEKGAAVLESVFEELPDNTTVAWYLAHFRKAAGNTEGAVETFRKILELDPTNTSAHLEIGRIHVAAEDFASARDEYFAALEKNEKANPDLDYEKDAFFSELLGLTSQYGQRGRFDEAIELLVKLSEKAPRYGFVWSNLGLVYRDSGKFEKARDAYKKAADLLPFDAQVLNDYAVVLDYNFGRRDDAYPLYKRAVEISQNGDAIENLARYYLLNGQFEDAIRMADIGLRFESERLMYHNYKNRALARLKELSSQPTGE